MSKHTPGPWYWDSDPIKGDPLSRVRYRVAARGRTITQCYYSSGDEASEWDTRLIAAAPDLLEALRIAREIVVTERDAAHQGVVNPSTGVIDDSDDADWVAEYDRALAQIDAAIAKATGEKA